MQSDGGVDAFHWRKVKSVHRTAGHPHRGFRRVPELHAGCHLFVLQWHADIFQDSCRGRGLRRYSLSLYDVFQTTITANTYLFKQAYEIDGLIAVCGHSSLSGLRGPPEG